MIPLFMVPDYDGIYKITPFSLYIPKGWNEVYDTLCQFFKEKDFKVETISKEVLFMVVCNDPHCEFCIYAQKYMVLYDNQYDIILSFDLLNGDSAFMTFIMDTLYSRLVENNLSTVNQEYSFDNLM